MYLSFADSVYICMYVCMYLSFDSTGVGAGRNLASKGAHFKRSNGASRFFDG